MERAPVAIAAFRGESGAGAASTPYGRLGGQTCRVVACNVHGRKEADVRREVQAIAKELSRKEARVEVDGGAGN